MKEKNGFTLIELIAVIVLLSIIATLAILSVGSIKNKVNEKQYRNLASTIEAAAETYAEETGVNKMFVQTLIDKGLVATDDETNQVYDPRDNTALNCQVVEYVDGKAELKISDDPSCDTAILSDDAIKIVYCPSSNSNCIPTSLPDEGWLNEEIILKVDTTGLVDIGDLSDATYRWTSPLAPDQVYNNSTLTISDTYVEDTFQVVLTLNNKKYTAYGKVKIDREPPKAYNLIDTDPENWSPNKTFKFELSDQESGLRGYAITFDPDNEPTKWEPVPTLGMKVTTNPITYTKNLSSLREGQSIYVWVKDMVGNINKADVNSATGGAFQINNIDTNFDDVTINGKPTEYAQSVSFTGTAQDLKSGLVGYYCSSSATPPSVNSSAWLPVGKTNDRYNITCPTSSKATKNGTYYIYAKDAVGNIGSAKWIVNNIDDNIDSISGYNTQTAWVTSTTLSGTAQDLKSGLVGYAFTKSSAKPSSWTSITQTNSSKTFTGPATSNGTWYFHVIDKAGNTRSTPITVNNIGKRYTKKFTYNKLSSRNVTKYESAPGLKVIESATVDNGSITAYVSGDYLEFYLRNGITREDYYWDTFYNSSYLRSYNAYPDTYCTNWLCNYGGESDGDGYCVAPRYAENYSYRVYYDRYVGDYYDMKGDYFTTTCNCSDGKYSCWGSGNTPCREKGFSRGANRSGQTYYGCQSAYKSGGTCSGSGQVKDSYSYCWGTCVWQGDYSARCQSTRTDYYCERGDTLSGRTCYWCSYGSLVGTRTCEYDDKVWYDYWSYTVSVTYIAA